MTKEEIKKLRKWMLPAKLMDAALKVACASSIITSHEWFSLAFLIASEVVTQFILHVEMYSPPPNQTNSND